jgi:hypothetical protein
MQPIDDFEIMRDVVRMLTSGQSSIYISQHTVVKTFITDRDGKK